MHEFKLLGGARRVIDLCELDVLDNTLPLNSLRKVLSGEILTVSLSQLAEPMLTLQNGIQDLALGFPLVQISGTSMPLFLWRMNVTPEGELCRADNALAYNRELADLVSERFRFDLGALLTEELGDSAVLTSEKIVSVCNLLARKFSWDDAYSAANLVRLAAFMSADTFAWSAVFGNFTPNNISDNITANAEAVSENLAHAEEKVLDEVAPSVPINMEAPVEPTPEVDAEENLSRDYPISYLPTSPMQEAVLQAVDAGQNVIVDGEKGVGKTYNLTALLAQTLLDGKNALVICNDNSSLVELQRLANHYGFSDLILALSDDTADKQKLLDALAALPDHIKRKSSVDGDLFRRDLRSAKNARRSITAAHEGLHRPLLSEHSWQNLVGQFLTAQQEQGKQLLSNKLSARDYEFTEAEYLDLRQILNENEYLLAPLATLSHPLNALHDKVFSNASRTDAEFATEQRLKKYLGEVVNLYHELSVLSENYADNLQLHYDDYTRKLRQRAAFLQRDIKDYAEEYGKDFEEFGTLTSAKLSIVGWFSRRSRDIKSIKEELLRSYENFVKEYNSQRYFEHQFPALRGSSKFQQILTNLEQFNASLNEWQSRIPSLVREEAKRFSSHTVVADTGFANRYKDADLAVNNLLAQLNKEELFAKVFRTDAYTFPTKRDYLETVQDEISTAYQALRDFGPYYDWKTNWLAMPEKARKVTEATMKVRPLDWHIAFESWYLSAFLGRHYLAALPEDDFDANKAVDAYSDLRERTGVQIMHDTRTRQGAALERIKKDKRDLMRVLFSAKNAQNQIGNNVSGILKTDLGAIAEALPILVLSADLAQMVFENNENLFDYIFIDDANTLPATCGTLLNLGRTKVVFGNSKKGTANNLFSAVKGLGFGENIQLKSHSEDDALDNDPTFETQVARLLGGYFGNDRISLRTRVEGVFVDILIKSDKPEQLPLAVFADGILRSSTPHSAEMQREQIRILESKGYRTFSIWSTDWWRNPERAAKRLAAAILK